MGDPEQHPPGTLRYFDKTTEQWVVAAPRSPWYSTVTMLASEVWTSLDGWKPIYDDEPAAICRACDRPFSDPPCSAGSDGSHHYGHPHNV